MVTGNSRQDGGAAIVVGTTAQRSDLIQSLVPTVVSPAAGSVLLAVFQGQQQTGGYGVSITNIARDGDRLIVRASFTEPAPGALVTQVITSPAQVVTISTSDLVGAKSVTLFDDKGIERARAGLP